MAERGDEKEGDSPVISFFRTFGPVLGFLLVLTVSLLEIFRPDTVNVTWEVVTLLGFLLLTPYLDEIKRVWVPNVGGVAFRRDIDDAKRQVEELLAGLGEEHDGIVERRGAEEEFEVQEVTGEAETPGESEEMEENSPAGRNVRRAEGAVEGVGSNPDRVATDVYSLLDRSPRAALAKLRTETEEAIRSYLALRGHDVDRTMPMYELYDYVEEDEELGEDFSDTYQKVRELCNGAIRGEEVRTDDAVDIIQIGVDLIRYLNRKGDSEVEGS